MKGLVPGRAGTVGVVLWPVFLASLGLTFVEFGLPIYGKSLGASALSIRQRPSNTDDITT